MTEKRTHTDSKNRTWDQVWDRQKGWLPANPPSLQQNRGLTSASLPRELHVLTPAKTSAGASSGMPASLPAKKQQIQFELNANASTVLQPAKPPAPVVRF